MEIGIVLGLLALAVVLFALEAVSVDLLTLLLLMALVATGILTPGEAFAGLSSEIIIILGSIFVISGALQNTGVVDLIGARLLQWAGTNVNRLTLVMMSLAGGISAFINNTTATALFVGPVMGAAKKIKVSPSKLLIPLAYASILGGMCTLVGTSTNVAVSGYIARVGMEPLSLFEVTPIGLIALVIGIAYMMLAGRRLLPDTRDDSLTEEYSMREYLSEIVVLPESGMVGQRIFESELARMGFRILEVVRGNRRFLPRRSTVIEPGDVLLVKGKVEELMKVRATAGIEIQPEFKARDKALQSEDFRVAEVLVNPRSELIGTTLRESGFRQRLGLTVLAIYRHGLSIQDEIGKIRLRLGDVLLVQGPREVFQAIRRHKDVTLLEELSPALYRQKKGAIAVGLFIAAVVIGGFGWLPLSISFLAAAVLAVMLRCLTIEEAYEFVDWRVLILIGGMTGFGLAMEKTGAAEFVAAGIVRMLEPMGIYVIMLGFLLLTIGLTQPMSNAAAALVVLPVAISTAKSLGVNERTFAVTVMLAASISFVAPLEPSCILVYGPGRYRFMDFVKTGIVLTVVLVVVVLFLIPMFWPLHPMPGHSVSE